MELKEEETGLYGQDIRSKIGLRALQGQGAARRERDWQKWQLGAAKADDLVSGENADPVVQRIRQMDPKRWGKYSKAQILNDPVASRAAQELVMGSGGEGGGSLDQQALAWARANSGDPRAKAIMQRLGVPVEEE